MRLSFSSFDDFVSCEDACGTHNSAIPTMNANLNIVLILIDFCDNIENNNPMK